MQKHWLRNGRAGGLVGWLLALVMLLTACESGAEGGPLPTMGPVRNGGGQRNGVFSELTASTNCAEVGEEVTFTLHVRNDATFPITLTGSPVLDIIVRAAYQAQGPVQRWSASDQYPADINPIFVSGEDRTYVWHWKADGVYAPNPLQDNGVQVVVQFGVLGSENIVFQEAEHILGLGIRTINLGNGSTNCAKLPRP